MPSLEILEGLIGTGCAVACLYYARLGALAAGPQNSPPAGTPWHSALGEYARRNPFAAVFGALAFGFLVSSWSMYIAPRAIALPVPRTVEKWHVITKNVATPDRAQAEKITALQTTIDTDAATISAQKTEIDRLKQLVAKSATRHGLRSSALAGGNTEANPLEGTTAVLNKSFNPASTATGAAAPASPPPPVTNQGSAAAPGTSTTATSPATGSNAAPTNSTSGPPH
jgi:hypothetical protein